MNLKFGTLRSFRNRNYALYFSGQSISLIGTWMQRTGVSWVIYSMTHSAFMLGMTVFASQFPSFLLSLYGGILSDRHNRYKIILITQSAAMIQAFLLALLTLTNHYSVTGILTLSVLLGIINAFDMPARQPMIHEMIQDKADLPNALALNSSMANLARIVGPAMAGIILQKFGGGICFLVNALSFVAVLTSLLMMKLPAFRAPTIRKKIGSELSEGFHYLSHTPSIGIIMLMLTLMSLLVLPYDTLLPVFAKVIFKGDASTFGYIRSFIGLGAITGTFILASMKKGANLKFVLLINTILLGLGLMLFSHISYFPIAMLFAILCGYGTMSQSTICLTIIQVKTDPRMRGRVMSFLAMAIFGMLPLGSLMIGTISQRIGAPNAILFQGIMAIILVVIFAKFLLKELLVKRKLRNFSDLDNTNI